MHHRPLLVGAVATMLACGGAGQPRAARPTPPTATSDNPDAAPTPTSADVEILRRADVLLADSSHWDHFGDRTCPADARSWNLYCAIHRASIDVTGSSEHRSAAMQEVRLVVDERTRGVALEHRLMDYNNLATTSFTDVKAVLAEATRRIEAKVAKSP